MIIISIFLAEKYFYFLSFYSLKNVSLEEIPNIIDLKQVNKRNINGKSFLETLHIALQKVKLTCLTTI